MISLWWWTDFQLCISLHVWETAKFYSVGYISHIKINEKCHGIYLLRFLTYKGLLLLIAIKITFEHWCPNCIWTSNLGLMCPNVIPSKCGSIIHGSHLDRLSGHCSIYSLKISWIHHFLTFSHWGTCPGVQEKHLVLCRGTQAWNQHGFEFPN